MFVIFYDFHTFYLLAIYMTVMIFRFGISVKWSQFNDTSKYCLVPARK